MHIPPVNWLAVLVSAVAIFILGGLWYSKLLFAKKWIVLMGKTEEELRSANPSPLMFVYAFLCGFVISFALAVILNHFSDLQWCRGIEIAVLCWLFAGATSFANAVFSMKPKALWLIDSGYNLVSFIIAGVILSVWR
ncbi:MAG TPA: DUF1761 domain-containing protein [Thermoanaerobaculia bacterium]|nr:DUF1761 domain-containing protein [Thermoanaerobaculia bacterium]